ncbi:chorismate mutase [Methylacidimicrobium sp. AP8]|uniref:chorismate mutase n=1 Tax=Methylacidimicrobium sp. AP8 TaxID=2730359 RepID=UPI001921ED4A|nr:chorismate mutase [Methylacidimicrobium sp. AP8]
MSPSEREIARLRLQMGEIDARLLALLNRRMEIARAVGDWKRRNGFLIFDPIREEAVIADLIRRNAGSLSERAIRAIFLEIFSSARAEQGVLRIGCAGGAAGLLAAHSRFGASDRFRLVRSAAEGKRLLAAQSIDVLVVPKQGLLDLPTAPREASPALPPCWTIRGEIDCPSAFPHSRAARFGFYIVTAGGGQPLPPDVPEPHKAVFFLAGASRESMDRWTRRWGGCWIRADARKRGRDPAREPESAALWEVSVPPPPDAVQACCREVCGDSAWIVRLGTYAIASVTCNEQATRQ